MDAPWVPPYFGSYEQLVQELLGNPFLGGGPPPRPRVEALSADPVPDPWRVRRGRLPSTVTMADRSGRLSGFGARLARSRSQRGRSGERRSCAAPTARSTSSSTTIAEPPGIRRGRCRGPGPWVFGLASQLSLIASSLQEGGLRNAVLAAAGRVVSKGVAAASPGR